MLRLPLIMRLPMRLRVPLTMRVLVTARTGMYPTFPTPQDEPKHMLSAYLTSMSSLNRIPAAVMTLTMRRRHCHYCSRLRKLWILTEKPLGHFSRHLSLIRIPHFALAMLPPDPTVIAKFIPATTPRGERQALVRRFARTSR